MRLPRAVEIIAHRGASRDRLENTLGAFRTALEQGADAFELDVHATSDGTVVVHHDPTVKVGGAFGTFMGMGGAGHSAGASDNDSLAGTAAKLGASDNDSLGRAPVQEVAIAAVTYAELSDIRLKNGEAIPTLDDVLELAAGRATVYVEVKGANIELLVVECLKRHPGTPTAVHSFDHRIPHKIGSIDGSIPRGILSSSYVLDLSHMIRSVDARDMWQHQALVDQAFVDSAHSAGARVVVWTENSVEHAAGLVQMGVDAICTDIPVVMRSGLAERGLVSPEPTYLSSR